MFDQNQPNFKCRQHIKSVAIVTLIASAVAPFASANETSADTASHSTTASQSVSTPLSLQQAIHIALQSNPDLLVLQRELEASEGQLLQSQARPNPELAYLLEDTRSETRTQILQLNIPVELGGKRAARIAAAQGGQALARAELAAQRNVVRAAVIAAFFDVLATQERVSLIQASIDLAKRGSEAVAKRVSAGKVSPVEESKARVTEAGVKFELSQAHSEQRSAVRRLSNLLGANTSRGLEVNGKLTAMPALPQQHLIEQQLEHTPAMQRAQIEVQRRKSLVDVERSKRIPDLTLNFGIKRPNELQRNQVVVGFSLPIPLFDRNQGNVLEALKREDKAREELQAAKLRLSNDVLLAYERLSVARDEISALQSEVLPGANSAYDAASLGFTHGKFSFLEVLDAQRTLLAAKTQYIKAQAEAHRSAADLDRLLGTRNSISVSTTQE